MCVVFKKWLLNDNLLGSYDASKKLIRSLGLKFMKIHACPNDFMLCYKETKNLPMCTSSRLIWYTHNVGGRATKRVPRKILQYLHIISRLQQLCMSWKIIEYMTWHKFNPVSFGSMIHLCHGEAWRHFDDTFLNFSSNPQTVRLGLCVNGFSPFEYLTKSNSIWFTVYNLQI